MFQIQLNLFLVLHLTPWTVQTMGTVKLSYHCLKWVQMRRKRCSKLATFLILHKNVEISSRCLVKTEALQCIFKEMLQCSIIEPLAIPQVVAVLQSVEFQQPAIKLIFLVCRQKREFRSKYYDIMTFKVMQCLQRRMKTRLKNYGWHCE